VAAATGTVGPSPPVTRDSLSLLVTAGGAGIPDWVSRWCRRTGHEVRATVAPAVEAAVQAARTGAALLVPRDPAPDPGGRTVLVAIHDLPADAPVLAAATDAAQGLGSEVVAVHAVPLSFGERSVGLGEALRHGRAVLDRATTGPGPAGVRVSARLDRRWPHEVVGADLDAGLLVVGGSRHDPPRLLGPVARSALAHAPCPVLIVPR
jgi:nucleotide-binding universal stress UspA family protein